MTPIRTLSNLPKLHHRHGGEMTPEIEAMGVTEIAGQVVTVKCNVPNFEKAFSEYRFPDGRYLYFGLELRFVES